MDSRHIGTQALIESEQRAMIAASCNRRSDFRLRGTIEALNSAPGTGIQAVYELSVSISSLANGPIEEDGPEVAI
uniref:ATP-binding protein n=1 Tax=Mesocestoides corti TaxID=53468 RepID=A0A5K3G6D4_MESCO